MAQTLGAARARQDHSRTTRRARRIGSLVAVAAAASVIAACGSDDGGSGNATSTSAPTTAAPTTTVTTAAPTSAPAAEQAVATTPSTTVAPTERIDWANHVYDERCGSAEPIELTDGGFEPAAYNRDGSHLQVTLVGAEPIATRPTSVFVHLSCIAGGPGAALSGELYFVFDVDAGGTAVQQLAVVGEPDARHVINDDGVIVIDDTTFGANDPNCCPSVFRSRQIVWGDDGLPVLTEGSRPDTPAMPPADGQACVATELDSATADPSQALLLEEALQVAGFDPGPVDGVLDDAAMGAVVRLIEFNAGNPALHSTGDAPYDNLHAEARVHGVVRAPVLDVLGIGCADIAQLPAR